MAALHNGARNPIAKDTPAFVSSGIAQEAAP